MPRRIDLERNNLLRRRSKDNIKRKHLSKLKDLLRLNMIFFKHRERRNWQNLMRKSLLLRQRLRDFKRRQLMLRPLDKKLLLIESNSRRRLRTRKSEPRKLRRLLRPLRQEESIMKIKPPDGRRLQDLPVKSP